VTSPDRSRCHAGPPSGLADETIQPRVGSIPLVASARSTKAARVNGRSSPVAITT
jgi:hypothetical protein